MTTSQKLDIAAGHTLRALGPEVASVSSGAVLSRLVERPAPIA